MLVEQHYLRSPLRSFSELDMLNNNNGMMNGAATANLSLEEKALLAARSQLFLRAAAVAASSSPFAGASASTSAGGPMLYRPRPEMPSPIPLQQLWSQWACLGPQSLLAAHSHFAMAAAAAASMQAAPDGLPRLPRPVYPTHRFSPYPLPPPSAPKELSSPPLSCSSTPDSCRADNNCDGASS